MALKQTQAVMDDLDKAILGLTGLLADVRAGKKWKMPLLPHQQQCLADLLDGTMSAICEERCCLSRIYEIFAQYATDPDGNNLQP